MTIDKEKKENRYDEIIFDLGCASATWIKRDIHRAKSRVRRTKWERKREMVTNLSRNRFAFGQ